jgi:5-methylcytosine-specific restriction endonuclease McrA
VESVLKLNADYTPIAVVTWMDALSLILDEKADFIAGFDRQVRSPSVSFQMPAVIRLRRYVKGLGKVMCNRENILARDRYTCQYCGARPKWPNGKPKIDDLTLEHIVPRMNSVNGKVFLPWLRAWRNVSSWENMICACYACNNGKGDTPLERSGKKLRRYPKPLDRLGVIQIILSRHTIPDEWKDYLPEDSEWRDYWSAELED